MIEFALILAGGGSTVAGGYAIGRVVFPSLNLPATVRFGVGSALLANVVFLTLLLDKARDRVLFGLLLASLLLLLPRRPGLPKLPAGLPQRPLFWLATLGTATYGILYLVHALAPEIQPDARSYHLGLVRQWLNFNGFTGMIGFYESLPHGLEMLFVPAFAIGAHSAAKLVHFAFLAATVPLLILAGKKLGLETWQAGCAAGLYACAPVVGVTGTAAYNDAALVFYIVATAVALLLWDDDRSRRYLIVGGLLAGFCYAIKITGLLIAPLGVLFLLWRKRPKDATIYTVAASVMIAPWMIRNAVWTGNPLAPLMNELFENPYFHIATEARLAETLRTYGGVTLGSLPLELTVLGEGLRGLIGPVFLLLPIALLALRKRAGRVALLLAALMSIPWLLNHGTRFLMPSLPFLSMALVVAMPRPAAVALCCLHAVLSLPPVVFTYADSNAWRLKGLPLAAALRVEPEQEYLRRSFWEYKLAELIQASVPANERVLDLFRAPAAYFDAMALGEWHSAATDRMREALELGSKTGGGAFSEIEANWTETPLTALRFRLRESHGADWSIQEVRLQDPAGGGERTGWRLSAWPDIWEAPLAFDHNLVTKWAAWESPRPDMYLQIHFPRPHPITGATLVEPAWEKQTEVEFLGQTADGLWRRLEEHPSAVPHAAIDVRRSAVGVLQQNGVTHLLIPVTDSPFAEIGRSMIESPVEWGVAVVGKVRGVYLLRVL